MECLTHLVLYQVRTGQGWEKWESSLVMVWCSDEISSSSLLSIGWDICRGRTEGTLRRGPRGPERFDWQCIASYYFYLSTKLWEARFCKAAKLIGSNLRCIQHRETRKTGDFLDPFVKSSYAQSVLVRDQREFSFSLKIKLEIERKSFRSDTQESPEFGKENSKHEHALDSNDEMSISRGYLKPLRTML